MRVRVIPYSYAVPPAALAGLEAIVARAFGGSAALIVESPVSYGDEDTLAERAPTDVQAPVIALFNLTATPEPAAHGVFVKALAGAGPASPLLALVDESAFRARWPGDERRLAQRRGIWSELLTAQRVVPIFVDLAAPDLAFAEAAIDAALSAYDATRSRRAGPLVTDNLPIALSLISHTNAGKTTLARTLLSRDVGEVRDAPHVTTEAASFPLIDTEDGDALILWDTPGFGDSARLVRRLRQQGNPVGWFLSQVWDRFRDRSFWLTQKAVRNVRDQADVVLYLVNASEEPSDAGYLAPELAVLEWIGKPVIVLLNQTGPPRAYADELADETRWRRRTRPVDARARTADVRRFRPLLGAGIHAVRRRGAGAARRAATRIRSPRRRVEGAPDGAVRRLDGRARRAHRSRGLRPRGVAGRAADRPSSASRSDSRGRRARAPKNVPRPTMSARLEADLRASTDQLISDPRSRGSRRP